MTDQKIGEWRQPGTRNFIRVGDVVKVLPSAPGKRDSFEAKVTAIYHEGDSVVFQVVGGAHGRYHTRFIRAERIARLAQVRTSKETGITTRRERKRH